MRMPNFFTPIIPENLLPPDGTDQLEPPEAEVRYESALVETSLAIGKVPRHKVVSAYVQLALEKDEFSPEDAVEYLHARGVREAAAWDALSRHTTSHAILARRAQAFAKEIVEARPLKPPQPIPPVPKTQKPQRPPKLKKIPNFTDGSSLARQMPIELGTEMQRLLLRSLDISRLRDTILPLDETPYGEIKHPKKPVRGKHRHDLRFLSGDTVKVCNLPEQVLDEDERLILNVLLIFGKFGLRPAALYEVGMSAPNQTMNTFRKKVNPDAHGTVTRAKSPPTYRLETDYKQLRIRDMR